MMDDGLLRGEGVVSWVDVAGREAVRWRSQTANAQRPQKHATRMVTPAWHDPAGVTILVACFCGLWALAVWLRHRTASRPATSTQDTTPSPRNNPSSIIHHPSSIRLAAPVWPLFALAAWIVLTEIGVESWYR